MNVSGAALADLLSGLVEGIEIGGEKLGIKLELNWLDLAAKMAKKDKDGKILTTGTKQVYNLGKVKNNTVADLRNITGDAANALVTLLDTILTDNNCKAIKNLVTGLLANAELPAEVNDLINNALGSAANLKGVLATLVLVLTGDNDVSEYDYIFKYLGKLAVENGDKASTAVANLDTVLVKGAPIIVKLLGENAEDGSFLKTLADAIPENGGLNDMVNGLLNDLLFTEDLMSTITGALLGLLKGLQPDLLDTIKQFVGIDLSPVAFAAATKNAQLIAYVGNAATWADVVTAKTDKDGKIAPVFTGVNGKDAWINSLLSLLVPLEDVLAFLLTGGELTVTIEGKDGKKSKVEIAGGNAYETALIPLLLQGLGLEELMNGTNKAAITDIKTAKTANDAIRNVLDYILVDLIGAVTAAPLDSIITILGNLSYFIANNDVEVVIKNLVAPVLSIVDALDSVVTMEQLDALIEGLVKVELPNGKMLNITNIFTIAGDNGKILIDLINGLLPEIKVMDGNKEVAVVNALPADFFLNLAKSAVTVTKYDGTTLEAGKTDAKTWTTDSGNAIMYVLSTVLTADFMNILCEAIGLKATNEDGSANMVYSILQSLADKDEELIDLILMLFSEYLVEYKEYNLPDMNKITNENVSQQVGDVLAGIDGLIPMLLDLLGTGATGLDDIVYPLFVKDDIANALVSAVVKLLASLPADTLSMIEGLVDELSNLVNTADGGFSIAPATFKATKFGSKLAAYIGDAKTWNDVWMAHSEEKDGDRVATAYTWGINDKADFIALISDMLLPLDCILALLLRGGMIEAEFNGSNFKGKKLAILDGVTICGGDGYNYSIIPLLEALGATPMTQAKYEEEAKKCGSSLKPILDMLFAQVDAILAQPVNSVLSILANLFYAIANGNVAILIENLIAPVNNLIAAVDPIFPIAIEINLGNIGQDQDKYPILTTYLGKEHPAVDAGVSFKLAAGDLEALLEGVISGIAIGGTPLGLSVDFDFAKLARMCAADKNGDGKIDFTGSKMDTKYDIYPNDNGYKNVVGDKAYTFYAILATILTEENWNAIKTALNLNLGDFEGIVNGIIKNPASILDVIANILGGEVSYIPVQNRLIDLVGFDYRSYSFLTETNADIIANNLDDLIVDILTKAGIAGGSLKGLVGGLLTNDVASSLVGAITGLLGGESVEGILGTISSLATGESAILVVYDEKGNVKPLGLDLTVQGFAKEYKKYSNRNAEFAKRLDAATKWSDVDATGINWGVNGTVTSLVNALAGILNPLNCVLELLLNGEGKTLGVLPSRNADGSIIMKDGKPVCVANIKGGNGYDYAIIPLLEAFGLEAKDVKTQKQYAEAVANDGANTLGYILGKIGSWADWLLARPVDRLLTILPNVGYFLANEGFYLIVRNLAAPVFGILEVVSGIIPGLGDLLNGLDVAKLIHDINIPIQLLGAEYNFKIPEIDFLALAKTGSAKKEVATARSNAAGSFKTAITNPKDYVKNYPDGYSNYIKEGNKNTQTYIASDKGDTLTWLFTFLFEMFEDKGNREALVQWLVNAFDLQSGAEQTVRYAIEELFKTTAAYNVPDIAVAALFQALGMAVTIDVIYRNDITTLQELFKQLFTDIANGSGCAYGSIARIMQQMTGVWYETIGPDEDHEEAVEEVEESLNWFQRIIKKIKEFFAKIFGVFG